jgi:glycerophosphoryl diester phosphodiesterase
MCSRILYVTRTTTQIFPNNTLTLHNYPARITPPGRIGRVNMSRVHQLRYTEDGEAFFADPSLRSSVMGDLSIVPAPANYVIEFEMMWPEIPASAIHSGIAFAKVDDRSYGFTLENPTGGYHVVIRGSGNMQLFRHTAEVAAGTMLAEAMTAAPQPGEYMTFEVTVSPTQVQLTRTDVDPDVTVSSNDTTYRGPYFHLSTGSVTSSAQTPHWRNVRQIAL